MQFRKSGEPFITHPVEVTRILAELKMDYESLIAGLLHDTVEDTENVKFEEIEVSCMPVGLRLKPVLHGVLQLQTIDTVHCGRVGVQHCLQALLGVFLHSWPAG